jgi:hypothetical protein
VDDPVLERLTAALDGLLFEQLLVIADRLEETGETDLAKAYRFMSQERLIPMRFNDFWHWRRNLPEALPLSHQLPPKATVALSMLPLRIGLSHNEAATMHKAYRRGAEALVLSWKMDVEQVLRVQQAENATALVQRHRDLQRLAELEDAEPGPDVAEELGLDDIPF